MKRFFTLYIVLVLVLCGAANSVISGYRRASDSYIRDRVVQLKGNNEACSGIQVKAPSGEVYILTAAHCKDLANEEGEMEATTERGNMSMVHIIAGDAQHDLLLLSSATRNSIDVADKVYKHQHVHTLTHGGVFPSYRTDGELLEERELNVNKGPIMSQEDMDRCPSTPWSGPVMDIFGLSCRMKMNMMITTALVIPGSSGGAVLDASGNLIGIVSCSAGLFSGIVPLHDIQEFLKGK